jgi:PAS domain S-box-containing protein
MKTKPGTRSLTLLYAGSEQGRAERIENQLRGSHLDYSVVAVETVDDIIEEVNDQQLVALIIEHDLPDGEGIKAANRAREIQSSLLTVLLAEQPDPSLADRAYEAGVDEFVHDTGETATRVAGHHVKNNLPDGPAASDPQIGRHMETLAATATDAIVSIDEASVIRYANPAVEDIFGYEPSEVVGENLDILMRDDLAERHREGMREYLMTGERTLDWHDIELPGQHKDGHEIPLSISFSEFTVDSTRYFTGVIRDIRERKRLESERELYHETTQRILQADSFEDGLQTAVDAIGSAMNWEYGEAWIHAENNHLERVLDPYTASDAAEAFAETTSPVSFERGEGLVGRVWESGSYEWIVDVTDGDASFVRDTEADRSGVRAALAVPIVSDRSVVAVMVFFQSESREPDEAIIEATTTIAADLGHLMQRLQVESELREERSLKDRVLETNPAGIVILEPDGTFRYINDRAGEMLGLDEFEGPLTRDDIDAEALSFEGDPVTEENRPHRRVIDDGEEIAGQARIEVDGEDRWLSVNGAPLYGEDGETTSAVFSLQDVTEQREREQRLQQYEAVMQTVSDGVYALDDEGRFVLVNDAYADLLGYERSELIGEPASEFVSERITDAASSLQEQIEADGAEEATLEATLTTASGEKVPIEARIVLYELGDGRHGRAGVVRDITERKRREERLAQLNEIGQSLTTAETPTEVADIVVQGAREVLNLPLTTVEYYNESEGRLVSAARTDELRDLVGEAPVFESEEDLPWHVFAASERQVVSNVEEDTLVDSGETPLESGIVLPLGTHGVFIAGATNPDAFTDSDVQFARILVANALAALDRVDREQELREKTEVLREHNESLERINRLNSVIRNLTQQLTQASTREEIETAVCKELSSADPYVFAWIGEERSTTDEIEPRTWAGREDGYLDAITVTAREGETAEGPAGTAIQTLEPAVQNNLQSDPPFEPWRTEALRRDYRSSISVPLTYRDTMYGLLNIYADETGVFDKMEVAVLDELGEMIGYAINAIERKKALVSDTAVELTFDLSDKSVPALEFAAEVGAEFEFETLVEQSNGSIRAFFTVSRADHDTVYDFCKRAPTVDKVSLLTEVDGGHRYEAVVSGSGFLGQLISYGAHPTEMTANPTGGRVTVEFPKSGDIQSFTRMFTREYDGAELVSRKEYDRPVQTREQFEANYKERLTERQLEVVKTAYFNGFFEWPRDTSGKELAAKLDVSQPTVSRHIRNSERKLLDTVFEDEE